MIYNRPQLPLTGSISRADLQRQTDDFTVAIDSADVASVATQLGASAAALNYLQNSDFRSWPQTSTGVPATWTITATDWYARGVYSAGSSGIIVARSEDTVHDHVIYCASITGDPNATECKFGQRISAAVAAAFLEGQATLTIELENKTGGSLTPELVFESCDVRDDFSATSAVTSWALSAVANNARVTLTKTIDLSAFKTVTRRGGLLYVRLLGINSGAKEWRVYYSRLEPGTIATPRRIDRATAAAAATSTDTINYFENPAFTHWSLGGTFSVAVEDADNYFCERWGTTPSDGGTTCVVLRAVSAPDTRSKYALQVTGNVAATGTTDIHQRIRSHTAAHLLVDTLNVSFWVFNNTGASFTPTLRIDTASASNSTTWTNRLSQSMQPCSSGAWTRVTLSTTPAALTNWTNGARISLRFGSGTLDSGTKSIRVAQAQLIRGTAASTFIDEPFPHAQSASTARTAVGLSAVRASSSSVTVTCAEAVCVAADGAAVVARNISTTLTDAGGTAFSNGQWYLVKICADETGAATAVAYLETTGVITPPVGNLWMSGVVAAFYYTGGAVSDFSQRGHIVSTLANAFNTTTVAADTYQAVAVAAGLEFSCPEIALALRGSVGGTVSATQRIALALTAGGLGAADFLCANSAVTLDGFSGAASQFQMPIGATRTLFAKSAAVLGTVIRISTTGFELP